MAGQSVFTTENRDSRLPVQAPERPTPLSSIIHANATLASQDMLGEEDLERNGYYDQITARLRTAMPQSTSSLFLHGDPYVSATDPLGGKQYDEQRIWSDVSLYRKTHPDFLKDIGASNPVEFHSWVQQQRAGTRAQAQAVVDRQSGLSQNAVGFVTGAVVGLGDPINAGMLGAGGAAHSLLNVMARDAVINGVSTAVEEPFTAAARQRFGETTTVGGAVEDVTQGAVGGALFGGAAHTLGHVASAATAKLFGKSDAELAQHFADTVPADSRTPDEAAGLHVLQRQADIDASNPYVPSPAGNGAHADGLGRAMSNLQAAGDRTGQTPLRPASPLTPDRIIRFVMGPLEGGSQVVHYSDADGGTTKYGIAAKFNPGVDVANLSADQAAAIARDKYWFPELNSADPRTAAVAFDAGYIGGPDVGRRILRESGGDPARALELYRDHLNHIADTVPGKERYRKGWNRRVDKLSELIAGDDRPILQNGGSYGSDDDFRLAQESSDIASMAAAIERSRPDEPAADPLRQADAPEPTDVRADIDPIAEPQAMAAAPDDVASGSEGSAVPEGAPLTEEAAAPEPVAASVPQTVAAVRAFAQQDPEPLQPERIADALGITPQEASTALQAVAAQPGSSIVQRSDGVVQRKPAGPLDTAPPSQPEQTLRQYFAATRQRSEEPRPAYVIRDASTGEVHGWSTSRKQVEARRAAQAEPDRWEVGKATPEDFPDDAVPHAPPTTSERIDGPTDKAAQAQVESTLHDARVLLEQHPDLTFRMGEEGGEEKLSDILADLDEDDAAIAAVRNCL